MVEAGVVDLMLAFQGVAALPVFVARFVATAAMFDDRIFWTIAAASFFWG